MTIATGWKAVLVILASIDDAWEGGDFLELEEVQSKVVSSSFSSTERDISLLLRSSTTIIRLFLLSKIRPIRIARGSGANHDSLRSYLSERVQMFASCIDSSFLY